MTDRSVSVVVPCRDEAEFIEGLLRALLEQDRPASETIIVDNGSTDATVARVEAFSSAHPEMRLRVIPCDRTGAAAAMNVGIRAAAGEIIVRIDGHSRPVTGYLRRAVERLQEPRAGVVGGVWQIVPGANTLRARAIALAVASRLGSGGAEYRRPGEWRAAMDVDTVPFGCYTRKLWEELDGYDDNLLVVEDGDFNRRARQAGYRVILDPELACTYHARRRFRTLALQYFRYGWWKALLLMRHPKALRIRQVIPLGFVTLVLALVIGSAWWALAKTLLVLLLSVYGAVLLVAATDVAYRAGGIALSPLIAVAYVMIHCGWGVGGLTYLLTGGRWPPWYPPGSVAARP
jgi:succinoglycan biosynthesis protein ExoA